MTSLDDYVARVPIQSMYRPYVTAWEDTMGKIKFCIPGKKYQIFLSGVQEYHCSDGIQCGSLIIVSGGRIKGYHYQDFS